MKDRKKDKQRERERERKREKEREVTHTALIDVASAQHCQVVKKMRGRITAIIPAAQQQSFFGDAVSLKEQRNDVTCNRPQLKTETCAGSQ